jgi:hypothetical protein
MKISQMKISQMKISKINSIGRRRVGYAPRAGMMLLCGI